VHSALSQRLESLHVVEPCFIAENVAKLSNVKELCIDLTASNDAELNEKSFGVLLKQEMQGLKRLSFSSECWPKPKDLEHDALSLWLHQSLMTVDYFCCGVEGESLLAAMESVRSAVEASTARGRVFKVRFNRREYRFSWAKPLEAVSEFIHSIRQLVEVLDRKCSDWTLIVYGLGMRREGIDGFRGAMSSITAIDGCHVFMNERLRESQIDIVIRSDAMSGIQERWMMSCDKCQRQTPIYR